MKKMCSCPAKDDWFVNFLGCLICTPHKMKPSNTWVELLELCCAKHLTGVAEDRNVKALKLPAIQNHLRVPIQPAIHIQLKIIDNYCVCSCQDNET